MQARTLSIRELTRSLSLYQVQERGGDICSISRCIGREVEIEVITSPMRSLGVGGGFSLCLLSGEVGVGKTHLLSEITSRSAAGEGGGSKLSGCVAYADAPRTA